MLTRGVVWSAVLFFALGCGNKNKDVKDPTGQPTDTVEKKVALEILAAIDQAQITCKRIYDEADPDIIRANGTYNADKAQADYEECKSSFDDALAKDPSLAGYQGEIDDKPYDIPALQKMIDDLPGRIEIAKATYEEVEAARKEAERAEWEPLLKGDRLKVFQERGKPDLTDAEDTSAAAGAVAKTWIYQSKPREENGKMVIDVTTYVFNKSNRIVGKKPKVEVQEYIPPEEE